MWGSLASIILRNRYTFIGILAVLTAYMGIRASKIELSYDFAKVLPQSDVDYIGYENFKKKFGEDGSMMVMGFETNNLYKLDLYADWYKLGNEIKSIQGIDDILSLTNLFSLEKNDSTRTISLIPVVTKVPKTQDEVDSIKQVIKSLPFYTGRLYNKETNATLMTITFNKGDLNTKHRVEIIRTIKEKGMAFGQKHNLQMHFSGMPYIRTEVTAKVASELELFLILALIVTGIILFIFFRSWVSVAFSLGVVLIGVVWSLGSLEILGYKITILSGLIPPLIIVIGVPNCIFLINKYQSSYMKNGSKAIALSRMVQTIGVTLLLANITTAIGFGVLYFTNSALLVEFGVVAAINVMATYVITLILIPIILSFLPPPTAKHTKHLKGERINTILKYIDFLVHNKRKLIYLSIGVLTIVSLYGMKKINVMGYVVDDLPQKDPIYVDLRFFEQNFKGVLPFEISIDTKKPDGVTQNNAKTLYKINQLQRIFKRYDEFSLPLSLVEGIKFAHQAYKDGEVKYYYVMPQLSDLQKISEYVPEKNINSKQKLPRFIDSTKQTARVSFQMADVGSTKMKELIKELRPKIDSLFNPKDYKVSLTGHSLIFLKGNDYLLYNLFESLIIEILLITMVGLALFRSVRIILLSKLPCLIPLVVTAGIMGFLGIRFKPSTILIFSIAFGISSDHTIYFLTKYRQELTNKGRTVPEAISMAIMETGLSMIYTAVILFFGFFIFTASSFGGTAALGVLISVTLLVSVVTNLILLPAILLSIKSRFSKQEMSEKSLIEIKEDEDEEAVLINGDDQPKSK